ncbi:D-alanyl-D-alanine carboxypeptidase [Streptomyces sp. BK022]|uniref:D-alanyl-D-alanine carboxypeptidase n=1 Tax=Streptomyces sp. BK022 TaxID=2512123 RepID=UPI0010297393|nr:D-alanyl-D-alanine carboxypeptidase [Streptomyces sp. BK022]RZU29305.1 D-alanyl-D-alanine carboxypeptidase [Streptomyces sp. BK022]
MAGESPDRSKQHEDSVGSAGSVEDEELREAVSAWVRPPSGGSAKGKSVASGAGSAGTGKASGPSGKGAAEEGSGTSGSVAAVPDDTFKDSREAGSAEGPEKGDVEEDAAGAADDSGKGTGTSAAVDSGTDASAPAAKGDPDSAAEDAGKAPAGASAVPAAEDGTEDAPAAEADDAPESGSEATPKDADKAPAALDPKDTPGSAEDGTEDAPAAEADDAPESGSEATPKSADKAPAAQDAKDTPSAEDDESTSGSASKGAGKAVAAGAAVAAAKDDAESADEDDAEDAGTAASGSAGASADDSGAGTGTPAAESTTGAGEGDEGKPEDTTGAAKDDKGKGDAKPGAEPKGTPLPAPRGDAGPAAKAPGKPVDTPTTALKSPAARKPQVDQPTTMLKVGGKAKPAPAEQEAERTSKFVALKPDLKGPSARVEETRAVPQVGPERTTQQPLPPKPPLDLLAELTNTPPPPETPVRTLVRRVKVWTPLVILLVVILGVVQAMRALPQPTLALTAKDSYTFEGGKPDIPWPADGQAALDVQGIGSFGSSGSGKPVPIASVAKVMTAYLILRDHPLKSGAEGPKIPIDKAAQDQSKAGQESTVDVTRGDKITQREALEGVLIASANNVARLLARWDAGSEKAFVAKMNAAAKGLGMSGTTYTDPSGLTNSTVSTAADQVKLAKAAMRQPAFREVAAMMSYTDYKGTYHSNWNQLVGHNNVVGIKTGTTTSALGNLVFAAKQDVGGETRMVIGAVLRQPPGGRENTILSAALDHSDALIRAAQGALRSETVLKKGTVVGYVDDGLGGRTPVEVTEDVKAAGWAGLKVRLSFTSGTIPHTAKAGTEVGSLTVGDGSSAGAVKVPVALRADLAEPGLGAKLTRIG